MRNYIKGHSIRKVEDSWPKVTCRIEELTCLIDGQLILTPNILLWRESGMFSWRHQVTCYTLSQPLPRDYPSSLVPAHTTNWDPA